MLYVETAPLIAVLSGFPYNPQCILAAIYGLALVTMELHSNVRFWIDLARLELGVAAFADADDRGRGLLYDPQTSVRHDRSLTHLA